ncbi:MAG: histidinol dehydrogenase [Thermodesulfovibrionales bacterium]|nr:histidinol dehydrogenase [Thermodesulfovibrionales bacterium]
MRIIKQAKDISIFLNALRRRASGGDSTIERAVNSILSDVKKNGDEAVLRYTRKFDYTEAKTLRLSSAEISRYANKADKKVIRALEVSAKRIRKFHEMQKEESWIVRDSEYRKFSGDKRIKSVFSRSLLGQLIRPVRRVGVYVPGGKASYPSSVLMNVIPAQAAGVEEIAVCVPTPRGEVNPYVMAAIKMLGIKEVYRIGGAQAIGAMAYGTQTINKVDKIVGPGNIYVASAKRMVFGEVDIDMIAGPSEILIIADTSADSEFIAADLLSQAEHDELALAILITNSAILADKVYAEVARQLKVLRRKHIAKKSLDKYGAIIVTKNINEAAKLANIISPEHLEIMTKSPAALLPAIKNAGAIFLGRWTPEALGDYSAGPNHTLPTGGTARFFSPLGVYDFIKRSSILSFTKNGFMKLAKTVETIADVEGLEAHGNTIRVRMSDKLR